MEKLPESVESSRFVSHRARMLGEFDSRIRFAINKVQTKASNICKAML